MHDVLDSDEFPAEGIDLDALLTQVERKWLLQRMLRMEKMQAAEKLRMSFRSFRYRLMKHDLE